MGHYRKKSITTKNYEESGIPISTRLKMCSQKTVIKGSKAQTHNFDASFLKTSKTGDGTKRF